MKKIAVLAVIFLAVCISACLHYHTKPMEVDEYIENNKEWKIDDGRIEIYIPIDPLSHYYKLIMRYCTEILMVN